MPSEALWTLAIIAVFVVVSLVAVLLIVPKGKKVAQIPVQEGEPFELQARPNNEKPYRVCLRYRLKWTGVAGFGLACKVRCMVDDRVVVEEVVGVGFCGVEGLPRTKKAGMRYFMSSSKGVSSGSEVATIVLGETGDRPLGTIIAVTGEVRSAEDTTVEWLKVYIAG